MLRNGSSKKAVFLDRDGVINRAPIIEGLPYSPRNIQELEIILGVREAVTLLFSSGFEIVVVTNQPEVARGFLYIDDIEKIHEEISNQTGLKHFKVCFHDNEDRCDCRKPKPGMLSQAAKEFNLDLKQSFLVGDRWKDIQAGQEVGCRCFFIDYGYCEMKPKPPFDRVTSLLEAARVITENQDA